MTQQSLGKVVSRVGKLEALVEELLKDQPTESAIKTKMAELNISYTPDPIERINRVLEALHPHTVAESK